MYSEWPLSRLCSPSSVSWHLRINPTRSDLYGPINPIGFDHTIRLNQLRSDSINPNRSGPFPLIRDSYPIRSNSPIPVSPIWFNHLIPPIRSSRSIWSIRTDQSDPNRFILCSWSVSTPVVPGNRVSGCINPSMGCINPAHARVYQPFLSSLCHVLCVVSSLGLVYFSGVSTINRVYWINPLQSESRSSDP